MLFLRIAKQYTSLPSPFVLFIWLSTILSATRRCDDLQHIFFRAHYIRSMIRIKLRKDFRYGYYIGFPSGCQSASFTNSGEIFIHVPLVIATVPRPRAKRGLWLVCSRKSKRRQPMPTIHSLPPYAQPFRLSIFHFKRLLRLPLLR